MLTGNDSFRMHCGRDLLQLSISAHDPEETFRSGWLDYQMALDLRKYLLHSVSHYNL